MARERNPERDKARRIWLDSGGTLTARQVAEQVGVKPEQVRKWKSLDSWAAELEAQKPPRKRGGQPGNKNAAGAGAPHGNRNAETHGAYSTVRLADLPDEQREYIESITLDTGTNMPYDLRICLIEADRLSNPNGIVDPHIIGGVETNDAGEVVAYHISKHHPLSYDMTETGWTRVEAWGAKTGRRNVLHIMNRERIGQRRGVPFLAPVIEALKQLGRYTDAELVAAVVSGMFTVFIEKESASSDGGFGEIIPEDAQVDAGDDSTIELAPGAIVDLNEGEKAHDMNPGRPNTAFDGFVVAICRQIGAALEIPYELLVKNFNASYSASRGALLEAWKMFRMYRTWLANDFCQPVYEEWFAEAVAKGRIPAPGFFSDPLIRKAYTGAEWNGPAQGLLNPVQEVTAAEKRVQNGFSTRDREAMEMNGSDFYRNAAQLKREEKMLREVKENGENGNAAGKTEE